MSIKVKYIGGKAQKRDNVAGTGLTWEPNQVHEVGVDAANKLLGYPAIWVEASAKKRTPNPKQTETISERPGPASQAQVEPQKGAE